jgi:peptide/nickel transport system substrate-binding protein
MTQHSRTRRRVLAGIALPVVLAAITALAGCSGGSAPTGDEDGTELALAVPNDVAGWDPTKALGAGPVTWMEQAVYEGLVKCDATANITPNAAESFEVNDDNTEFTFQLRDGATFSDGSPVDAAAVKSAIEFLQTGGSTADRLGAVTVSTPDDETVVLTTPSPDPVLLTWLCQSYLASPTYIASGNLDEAPVGSGPYVLSEDGTTPGSVYTFTRRDDYWDADSFPYEKIVVNVISDVTARLNALKSGQIDATPILPSTVNEAEASNLSLLEESGSWAGLIIADRAGEVVPALGNLDVRKAMNMVFDREAIAESLYNGGATPTGQIFRKGNTAWIEGVDDTYAFDVDAAKALMEKAGYADGFDVDIPFISGFGWDSDMPMVIQQLGLIGIRVNQVTLTGPNAIPDLIGGTYPLIYWPLGNGGNPYQDITGVIAPEGTWNVLHQTDPQLQPVIEQALNATGDDAVALQQQINQYVIDNAWFAPIVYPTNYTAYNPDATTISESTDINGLNPNLRDFS